SAHTLRWARSERERSSIVAQASNRLRTWAAWGLNVHGVHQRHRCGRGSRTVTTVVRRRTGTSGRRARDGRPTTLHYRGSPRDNQGLCQSDRPAGSAITHLPLLLAAYMYASIRTLRIRPPTPDRSPSPTLFHTEHEQPSTTYTPPPDPVGPAPGHCRPRAAGSRDRKSTR